MELAKPSPGKNNLKGGKPFRIGTTSYIIPDDLVPNVNHLGPLVDDIELVLFESDDISNLPNREVIEELRYLKTKFNLSYTVHLPLDIELGSSDEAIRKRAVEKSIKTVNLSRELSPFAYIVHFHGNRRGRVPAIDIPSWQKALARSASELADADTPSELYCVETLDYPFELVADIAVQNGMSVCVDVGHLAFYGYDERKYLDRYWDICRVIHLHGNTNGSDHKDIGSLDPGLVKWLLDKLSDQPAILRVLTLEIFSSADLSSSMAVLERHLE